MSVRRLGVAVAALLAALGLAPSALAAPCAQTDTTCDDFDDDCDGVADDDYVGVESTCGVGGCQRSASTTCVGGAELPAFCIPGIPSAEVCNDVDDNCNGVTDEGIAASTHCGVGVCAAIGTLSVCQNGVMQPGTCTPGDATGADDDCNAIDDDCDGSADNHFQGATIACGSGACSVEGTTVCVDGQEQDDCSSLAALVCVDAGASSSDAGPDAGAALDAGSDTTPGGSGGQENGNGGSAGEPSAGGATSAGGSGGVGATDGSAGASASTPSGGASAGTPANAGSGTEPPAMVRLQPENGCSCDVPGSRSTLPHAGLGTLVLVALGVRRRRG